MMERKQFTFYSSFARALKRIRKDADRAKAYDAIIDYALSGIEPDLENLPDSVALAFELIRPTLDASKRKANSGRAGGTAKQSESKREANRKQDESKEEANGKQTAREKEGEKEKEKENECYNSPPTPPRGDQPRKRFIPPTVEEVAAYCRERKNGVDPKRFVDFYASKGWKVGNQPMKDWRAAVRTWERTESFNGKTRTYSAEIVEEMSQFDVLEE